MPTLFGTRLLSHQRFSAKRRDLPEQKCPESRVTARNWTASKRFRCVMGGKQSGPELGGTQAMTAASIKHLLWASTLVAALSTGLMAGVFFAFSTFVMKALARLPNPQGIQAMQSINLTAVNPIFMPALFGSTAVCLLLAGVLSRVKAPGRLLPARRRPALPGWSLFDYCRVQRATQQCAGPVDPGSMDGARLWARYLTSWSAWNHVRTLSSILASAAYAFALSRWNR